MTTGNKAAKNLGSMGTSGGGDNASAEVSPGRHLKIAGADKSSSGGKSQGDEKRYNNRAPQVREGGKV